MIWQNEDGSADFITTPTPFGNIRIHNLGGSQARVHEFPGGFSAKGSAQDIKIRCELEFLNRCYEAKNKISLPAILWEIVDEIPKASLAAVGYAVLGTFYIRTDYGKCDFYYEVPQSWKNFAVCSEDFVRGSSVDEVRTEIVRLYDLACHVALEPVNVDDEYSTDQWWYKELEDLVSNGTLDQKRALYTVRNLVESHSKHQRFVREKMSG